MFPIPSLIKTGMQAANTYNTQTNSKEAQTQITRQTGGQTRRTAKPQAHNKQPETRKNRHKPQERQTGGRGEPPKKSNKHTIVKVLVF